jgi:hypothetical protein
MRQVSKTLLIVLLAFIAAISLWTPLAPGHRGALVYAAECFICCRSRPGGDF